MILVSLGTQDKSFKRLLDAIVKCIEEGYINDRVVVQAGHTEYESDKLEIFDYLSIDKFNELMDEASLVISHGGVGTIMSALSKNKKVIGAARLSKYQEHTNDHQTQLLEEFDKKGYIIYAKDLDKFNEYLERSKTFIPNKYKSNTNRMINIVKNYIDNN